MATGNCVAAADVDAYAKALEAHTLATLTRLAAADDATLVKRETYYLEWDIVDHNDSGPSRDPSVVTVGVGSPYDDQGRITVARKTDGVVRLFADNPRHHVVEILACGTTCDIQGGAMQRPRTLVFKLLPDETLGPPLVTNVDAWSVYRAQLDVQTCYGNSPPP